MRPRRYPKLIPDEAPAEPAHQADVDFCLENNNKRGIINQWEFDFLLGISGYQSLSDAQADKLRVIKRKVETAIKYPNRGRR